MRLLKATVALSVCMTVSWAWGTTVNLPCLRNSTGISQSAQARVSATGESNGAKDSKGANNVWPNPPGTADTLAYTAGTGDVNISQLESKASVTAGAQCSCASNSTTSTPLLNSYGSATTLISTTNSDAVATAFAEADSWASGKFTIQENPTTPTKGSENGADVTIRGHFVLDVYGNGKSDELSETVTRTIDVTLGQSHLAADEDDDGWSVTGVLQASSKAVPTADESQVNDSYPFGMNVTYNFSQVANIDDEFEMEATVAIELNSAKDIEDEDLQTSWDLYYSVLAYCTVEDESL